MLTCELHRRLRVVVGWGTQWLEDHIYRHVLLFEHCVSYTCMMHDERSAVNGPGIIGYPPHAKCRPTKLFTLIGLRQALFPR